MPECKNKPIMDLVCMGKPEQGGCSDWPEWLAGLYPHVITVSMDEGGGWSLRGEQVCVGDYIANIYGNLVILRQSETEEIARVKAFCCEGPVTKAASYRLPFSYAVSAYKVTVDSMEGASRLEWPAWLANAVKAGAVYFDVGPFGADWLWRLNPRGHIIPLGHYLARCGDSGQICIVPPELFEGEKGKAEKTETVIGVSAESFTVRVVVGDNCAKGDGVRYATKGDACSGAKSISVAYRSWFVAVVTQEHTFCAIFKAGKRFNAAEGLAEPAINDPDAEPDRPPYKCGHPYIEHEAEAPITDGAAPFFLCPKCEADKNAKGKAAFVTWDDVVNAQGGALAQMLEEAKRKRKSVIRAEWIRETAVDLYCEMLEQDNGICGDMAHDALVAATKIYDGVKD